MKPDISERVAANAVENTIDSAVEKPKNTPPNEWVVISNGALNLALPIGQLVMINEWEKVIVRKSLVITIAGQRRLPAYYLSDDLQILPPPGKPLRYCVVFANENSAPQWGLLCDRVMRFAPQQSPPRALPALIRHPDSPIDGVMIETATDATQTWIFTTTAQAVTHYLERSLRNESPNRPVDMAC